MNAVCIQVVELYESSGLSINDIASELNLEVEAVKTCLIQHSSVYNKSLKSSEETFTDSEYLLAKSAIANSVFADDEAVRLRAAVFIVNEKKGRNDMIKNLKSAGNTNILIINQQMSRAKKALEKSKSKMIDVISSATSGGEEQAA